MADQAPAHWHARGTWWLGDGPGALATAAPTRSLDSRWELASARLSN